MPREKKPSVTRWRRAKRIGLTVRVVKRASIAALFILLPLAVALGCLPLAGSPAQRPANPAVRSHASCSRAHGVTRRPTGEPSRANRKRPASRPTVSNPRFPVDPDTARVLHAAVCPVRARDPLALDSRPGPARADRETALLIPATLECLPPGCGRSPPS